MGFVLLGIATLTATGFQAALIGNIAHGVITGLLFFLAGAIKDRAHTGDAGRARRAARDRAPAGRAARLRRDRLARACPAWPASGARRSPWSPPFERGGPLWTTLAVLAAIGGALTAAYFLRLLRRVTHGPPRPSLSTAAPTPAGSSWSPGRRWSCWPSCSGWCRGSWSILGGAVAAARSPRRWAEMIFACCRYLAAGTAVAVLLVDLLVPGRCGAVGAWRSLGAAAHRGRRRRWLPSGEFRTLCAGWPTAPTCSTTGRAWSPSCSPR